MYNTRAAIPAGREAAGGHIAWGMEPQPPWNPRPGIRFWGVVIFDEGGRLHKSEQVGGRAP